MRTSRFRRSAICALLAALAASAVLFFALRPPLPVPVSDYGFRPRVLEMQSSVILDRLQWPGYDELRTLGITELSTSVTPDFLDHPDWWDALASWVSEGHREGFTVGMMVRNASAIDALTGRIVAAGADVIGYDEMMSTGALDQAGLTDAVTYARRLDPNLGLSITESDYSALQHIHEWLEETNATGVRMSSSNYANLSQAESIAGLQSPALLGHKHRHGIWVIFVADPLTEWDSYQRLSVWLTAVTGSGLDILLWQIDAAGAWRTNWPLVKARLAPNAPSSAATVPAPPSTTALCEPSTSSAILPRPNSRTAAETPKNEKDR